MSVKCQLISLIYPKEKLLFMFDQNENVKSLKFAEYPLKKQEKSSEDRTRQGCELRNTVHVLPTQRFPRISNEAFQHVNL